MYYSQLSPGQQKQLRRSIALHAPRTWWIGLGFWLLSLLLVAALLAAWHRWFPALFAPFLLNLLLTPLVLVGLPLLVFLVALLSALFTDQAAAIRGYKTLLRKHLQASMAVYYSPEGSQAVQEHLAALIQKSATPQKQQGHLLVLGGPGSGKTENLRYAVYRATELHRRAEKRLPIFIQMKYYNGFLRNLLAASSPQAPGTLLAYLLDEKNAQRRQGKETQKQKRQAGQEPELPGLKRLRSYLPLFIAQGRIVLLCDGMNELESEALEVVHGELMGLMQSANRVVMTCRELEYIEQERLQSLASRVEAIEKLPPLSARDVSEIVRTYRSRQPEPGTGRAMAPLSDQELEAMQAQIRRFYQSHRNTSPFMLVMLMRALRDPKIQAQSLSRGRLLQISVDQLLLSNGELAQISRPLRRSEQESMQEVRQFLSAVACAARRNGSRNALQLVKDRRFTSTSQWEDFLNVWLSDNDVDVRHYLPANIHLFLKIALHARLITLSNYGVLSFMHELIAEYLAAEYLRFIYHRKDPEDRAFWQSIYESEAQAPGLWSEPVAIWAGLEDQPGDVARFLLQTIDDYCRQERMNAEETELYHDRALALSLACMGVRAFEGLPDEILALLKQSVRVAEKRGQLAVIFKRCADEGGSEVYQALLPSLHIPGLLDLFLTLHDLYGRQGDNTISILLFDYLEMIAERSTATPQIETLVTLLGELGRARDDASVRPRAHLLSEPGKPPLLRAAALGILELLRNPDDVPLLIGYLYDTDQRVVEAAISALRTAGPALTLPRLREEESKLRQQTYAQVRLNLLSVLAGFYELRAENASSFASSAEMLVALVIQFFSAYDSKDTQQMALDLLNRQIQYSQYDASLVSIIVLDYIDAADVRLAEGIQRLLAQNGPAVAVHLMHYWKTRSKRELACIRMLDVLGKVSHPAVLPFLLHLLDEPVGGMQQALATALGQQPECVDPLLERMLAATATQSTVLIAVGALRQVGADCITSICEEFLHVGQAGNVSGFGLHHLVLLLDELRRGEMIPEKAMKGAVRALVALFEWLVSNVQIYEVVAVGLVPTLVGFSDPRIVTGLIRVLRRSEMALEKVCQAAVAGLSALGDMAFAPLIEELQSSLETPLTRRVRQALLGMLPFPLTRLLAVFTDPRPAVVQQVRLVFIANEQHSETVNFLIEHLLNGRSGEPVFEHTRTTLRGMQPAFAAPYLVKALGRTGWQTVKTLLQECPEPEVILPLLVNELSDAQRRAPASQVLLQFDSLSVLPWLVAGLENYAARLATRQLMEQMARTALQGRHDLLPAIVRLFDPAAARPKQNTLSLDVQRALSELLTTELASLSVPALIGGLAEPPLTEHCAAALARLVSIQERPGEVLTAILQALYDPSRRAGAHRALVACGSLAARPICALLADTDNEVVIEARQILAEMGETAFPYIHQLAHEPLRLPDAQGIFQLIPAQTVAEGLLTLLASNDAQKIEVALYLLAMGVEAENNAPRLDSEGLTRILLTRTLGHPDGNVRLGILSILLFFYSSRRTRIAQHIVSTVTRASEEQYRAEYLRALLLLGSEAEQPLGNAMALPVIPARVQLEMIGTLSTLGENEISRTYVKNLSLGMGGVQTLDFWQRTLGLRALGGLLASGIYHPTKLEELRNGFSTGLQERDRASFEFFDVLLGKRNLPELRRLNEALDRQGDEIRHLSEQVRQKQRELDHVTQQLYTLQRERDRERQRANDLQNQLGQRV